MGCVIAAYVIGRGVSGSSRSVFSTPGSPVDQSLFQTAQQLNAGADTPAERALASEAVRLSDHELDQAFASLLRAATQAATPATGPLKQLNDRIDGLRSKINADQDRIAKLGKQDTDAAADQLELTKAQLALDQDDLEDAQQDLSRAGGDQHAAIQRAITEHENAMKAAAAPGPVEAPRLETLSEQARVWFTLGDRKHQLTAAQNQAANRSAALAREHESLEKSIAPQSNSPPTLSQLHRLSDTRKQLADLDKRIEDSQQLANVYGRWQAAIDTRRNDVLHMLLRSLAIVFAIVLAMLLISRAIDRGFRGQLDAKRLHQVRAVCIIAVQIIALAAILLIVFGPPNEISTVIGLATAGLTLALKDFILAFLGWFTLMGKNGIRIGDWVEIRGVGGEVIEIGPMKTVLLEMGNWTSTGHPTGRRVSFMNSFAMEGHYFNFSTGGQWLWDELQIALPAGGEPYRLAEQIRQTVERATESDAREAEKDWERVTRQYGMRPFSARPAVDLRPSVNGLEVNVRYITRAPQRYEVKSRLFEAIVQLLHTGSSSQSGEIEAAAG